MAVHILFTVLAFTLCTADQLPCEETGDCAPTSCRSSPCQHGGTCTSTFSSYTCLCPPGYKGGNCEIRDPCWMSPCVNGGHCRESTSSSVGYECHCPSWYRGSNCDIYDPCSSSPCLNGGTCENVIFSSQGYKCSCPSWYTGSNCDMYDPCWLSPCHNGGVCQSKVSSLGYECDCPSGYTGNNCDITSDNSELPLDPAPSTSGRYSSSMSITYMLVPVVVVVKMVLCFGCIYVRRRRILIRQSATTSATIAVSNHTAPPCHVAAPPYRPRADVEGASGLATMNPGYDVTRTAPHHNVSCASESGIVGVNDLDSPPAYEEVQQQQWHNDRQQLI